MLASLTYLMYTVSPKDLPCHINVHRTTFDGYNDNTLSDTDSINSDVSSGISISDLNARTGRHSGKFDFLNYFLNLWLQLLWRILQLAGSQIQTDTIIIGASALVNI